uniref:cGMP-dependent protein kinase interacting domain-containing protein n=1 Tax=Globodera rostochiensis TaxID=31243 RepID=A0A914I4R9_GLORO
MPKLPLFFCFPPLSPSLSSISALLEQIFAQRGGRNILTGTPKEEAKSKDTPTVSIPFLSLILCISLTHPQQHHTISLIPPSGRTKKMVLDDDCINMSMDAAMLQNKGQIQHNVTSKRKEQLKRWESSEMNQVCTRRRPEHKSSVKFQDRDIFLSACVSGDEEEVEELLKNGSDINVSDIDGVTALHQAVIDSNPNMVRFLVDHRAAINAQDNEGWTPLHVAVCCGSLSIVKYLCEHGSDLSCVNSDRELPVDLAESDEMRTFLEQEMRRKNVDEQKAREREFTLLFEDCNRWIQSGHYLDKPHPRTGATALHVAASKGYNKLIGMLSRAGADVNAQDFEGWTPLHAAAHWGERDACRILMENGANLDALTHTGHTVFSLADKSISDYLVNLQEHQQQQNGAAAAPHSNGSSAVLQDMANLTMNREKEPSVDSERASKRSSSVYSSSDQDHSSEHCASTAAATAVHATHSTSTSPSLGSSSVLSNSSHLANTNNKNNTGDQKQRETTNSSSSMHSSPSAASSLLSSSNSINSNSNSSGNPNEQQPSSPASLVSSSTSNNTNGLQTSKSTTLKAAETIQRLRQQLPQGRSKTQSVDFGKALSSPLDTNPRLKSPPGTAPLVQSARSFWNSVHSNSSSSSANNVPQHPIGTTPLHQQQFNRFRQRFQQQQSVDSLSSTASSDQSGTETAKYPQSPTINPNRLHHRRQQHQLNLQFKNHHLKDSDTAMTIMFGNDSKNGTLSTAESSVTNVTATNSASESASCSSVTPSPSPSPIVASSVTLNSSPFVTVRKQPHCQQSTPPTQPISSRESEAERKAKSRLKRSTRRSTQGVTLEQLGEVSMRHHAPKHHGRTENGKEQQKQRTATIGRLGSDNSLELSNNKLTPNDLQPPPASPCSSTSSSSAYLTAASHRVVDQQSQKVQQQQNSTMPSSTASLIDELDKYRQLYERERDESERLRTERRMFERRIVALEYELEKSQQLQTDNEKLKDENIALVRVLAKLSK